MEIGKEELTAKSARIRLVRRELFLFVLLFLLFLSGCAAPGEPTERRRPIPEAVTDLSAAQAGNDVVLTFTLPKTTVEHRPLKQPLEVEIYRDFAPPRANSTIPPAATANPTLLATITSGVVEINTIEGHFRFADSLKAENFGGQAGGEAIYFVRTRASRKAESANSNPAQVRIYPAAEPIGDLKAEVTHLGVVLTWTAPQKTIVGSVPAVGSYSIYRAEIEPGAGAASAAPSRGVKAPLAKIADCGTTSYRDTQAEFRKTYVYSVRSVAKYPDETLESGDSNWVTVTPKNIFPPAAPQGLVVVFVPAVEKTPAHLELSWAINSESDIAGYNVYRSEQEGVPGTRLNSEMLLTPAFRDMNAVPGRRYFYTATAVDRSGNESPASAAAPGGVPAESQATP
ncbi:MAG: fibronectin type III domain-containing protein [Candidatus Acidiferrales bacterium]